MDHHVIDPNCKWGVFNILVVSPRQQWDEMESKWRLLLKSLDSQMCISFRVSERNLDAQICIWYQVYNQKVRDFNMNSIASHQILSLFIFIDLYSCTDQLIHFQQKISLDNYFDIINIALINGVL